MVRACYGGKHSACRGCGLNSPAVISVHAIEQCVEIKLKLH